MDDSEAADEAHPLDPAEARVLAQWSARQHARTLTDVMGAPVEVAYC